MNITFARFPFEVPPRLRYDGEQRIGDRRLLQFTEMDEASPSHGATFYLDPAAITEDALAKRRAEKLAEFTAGAVNCRAGASPATATAATGAVALQTEGTGQ